MVRAARVVTAIAVVALGLTGCAVALSPDDRAALQQLALVAGPSSGVDAALIDRTECWLPSAHPIDDDSEPDTAWRVLCRVHWHEADTGAQRYQDTTCIGDFADDPMLERCYRWTYYDLEPVFEDEPAVNAG